MSCGGHVVDPDAAVDAEIDASDAAVAPIDAPTDAPTDAVPSPSGHAVTSGGGVASSAGHRIQIRIGAPVPAGDSGSAGHRVRVGPGAIPWGSP
jgi:hypothetical protein